MAPIDKQEGSTDLHIGINHNGTDLHEAEEQDHEQSELDTAIMDENDDDERL